MKKLVLGIIIGAFLATALPVAAEEVAKRVSATVRSDFSIEVDGKPVKLDRSPLAYDGYSYLPVRELATLLGKEVDFKDGVIKLESQAGVTETTFSGVKSISLEGETYFNLKDYNDKFNPFAWAYDSEKNVAYLAEYKSATSNEVLKVYYEVDLNKEKNHFIHKGQTYVNIKHFKDPSELK